MDSIQTHLAAIQAKATTVPAEALLTKSSTKLTPPDRGTIENLWATMVQLYGHKWISSYGAAPDPMGVWGASLKGITPEMIKTGLNKLITRGYDWPPSAPEFSKLCRPSIEDFDVPCFDDAITLIGRISRHRETRLDPFTYTMYSKIGARMYDLNRMPERDYRAEMKRYYDATVKIVLSGGELAVQPELIEQQPKEFQPIKDSQEKFEELKKVLD